MAADPKLPDSSVVLNDFAGLINSVNPRDLPPGAGVVQVNATCIRAGALIIRQGTREVHFEA
jgi:hypothetical protein